MAEGRNARVAAGFGLGAAITATLALIRTRSAQAAPGGDFVVPDELLQLIIAMADASSAVQLQLDEMIKELASLSVNVQGWPPHARRIRTFTIVCAVANQSYRASEMVIPSGMSLLIRAHPVNAVGSLVHVATTAAECVNPNSAYPLQPSEIVTYNIQNAQDVYVSATVAGSIVIFTAEQAAA